MNNVVNYLRGTARVTVTGLFPERVVNLCAQNGVEFWGVDWRDEHLVTMTVRRKGLPKLEELDEEAAAVVEMQGFALK